MFYDDLLLQEHQPPQTEMGSEQGSEAGTGIRAGSGDISQTGSGSGDGSEFLPDLPSEEAEGAPLPQTGLEPDEKDAVMDLKAPGGMPFPQTGTETAEEDRGSAVPARTQSQSGRTVPRRRRVVRRTPVLAIGDGLSVETDADKARSDLLDLVESQKTGRILTGTIQGVERPKPETSLAVINSKRV